MEILIYNRSQKVIDQWIETCVLDGFTDNPQLMDKYSIKFKCGKADKILAENGPFDAIISETNSLMLMDNEFDQEVMIYYEKYDIDIQRRIQDNVKQFGFETVIGQPCLPVGCCMLTKFEPDTTDVPSLISAPMVEHLIETNETQKNGAQRAMYAALRFLYWYNKHEVGQPIRKILVPAMHDTSLQTFAALEMTLKPRFMKKTKGENFYEYGYTAVTRDDCQFKIKESVN